MTGRFLKIGVPLAILALVITAFAAQSPQKMAEIEAQQEPTPTWSHPENRYEVPVADGAVNPYYEASASTRSNSVLDDTRRPKMGLSASAQSQPPGIELCGGALGGTTYDFHHNDNNQQMVAVLPNGYGGQYAHFAWTHWDRIPDSLDAVDRFTAYNCWSQGGGLGLGNCGFQLDVPGDPLLARSGFPTIDVGSGDLGYVVLHARDEDEQLLGSSGMYTMWYFNSAAACFNIFGEEQFGNASIVEEGQVIWPHTRIDLAPAPGDVNDDVFHLVGHPTGDGRNTTMDDQLVYYRRVGGFGNAWEGPVALDNNAGTLNYHVAVDPTSDEIAVVYQRDNLDAAQLLQNGYLKSPDNGANWIAAGAGSFPAVIEPTVGPYVSFTNYAGPENEKPQSWLEVQGEYDNDGWLHAVWIEQVFSNLTADCRVKHWTEETGVTRTIKQAIDWDNQGSDGGRDLWLAVPNLAFGDGSTTCNDGPGDLTNYDYVYITYEQYGGPTAVEQNDVSASDNAQNLEIYIAVSNDGGNTFSPSVNLTNTKTPGCDGLTPGDECESERDPSMAHVVNDTIHIIYIWDTDAGDAVFGQGNWTFNPVMYYRIPGGTDAEILCPTIAPVYAGQLTNQDPDCEYNAALNAAAGPQQQIEDLILENFGNATLSGSVSEAPPVDWLVLTTGAFTINAGDPANIRTVTMDASAASVQSGGEGLYQSTIEVTHNDTTQASPQVFPVDFFVFDEFFCPEFVTLNTGWLWLEVSNVERQANQATATDGGLSRLDPVVGDTSYSIYDASLLIGVPPNPDTLVFRNTFGEGNGQPGFRALGNLEVDTSAYGLGSGKATAFAAQTTSDSLIGVDVEYIFPQDPDSCEFVLIKYKITNNSGGTFTDLAIGQATDFDVTPSLNNGDSLQIGSQNTGHLEADWNLVYQQGADTVGHVIVGDRTAQRWKGGVTAIQTFPAPRAWVAPNDPWLFARDGGGWHEGYLWQEMNDVGFELFPPNEPDPEEDLHAVMVMDQGLSLAPGEMKRYIVGYVSSNTGVDSTNLIENTKKAWRYCFGWSEFVEYDSMANPGAAVSYPYYAIGTHEDGIAGLCSGCSITEVDDPEDAFTFTPGADPCEGTIDFDGGSADTRHTATFRVQDLCSDYTDDCVIEVVVGEPVGCACPEQGNVADDAVLDAVDLNILIQILFFNATDIQDPLCPIFRSNINADAVSDAVDLNLLIQVLFFNGVLCDPCDLSAQPGTTCPGGPSY